MSRRDKIAQHLYKKYTPERPFQWKYVAPATKREYREAADVILRSQKKQEKRTRETPKRARNPSVVSVKNFTGTVTRNANGTATVKGTGKRLAR